MKNKILDILAVDKGCVGGFKMGAFLEMVAPEEDIKIRSFIDEGHDIVHPHWHKEVEVIYVKKGTINVGVNDQPIQLCEGDIYIINAGEVHYYFATPDSERVMLIFDPSLFQEMKTTDMKLKSLKSQITKVIPSSQQWNPHLIEKIRELIWTIYIECEQKNEGYVYAIKACMFQLITLIYRQVPLKNEEEVLTHPITHSEQKEILNKLDVIFDYIEANYKETIMLEEIADHVGFSQFYFTKFFKKNTGMTFVTFLNCYRLSKAKWLLANKNLPMSEVAYEAGFQSVKTFYRLFKEDTSVSPLQYQKQYFEVLEQRP